MASFALSPVLAAVLATQLEEEVGDDDQERLRSALHQLEAMRVAALKGNAVDGAAMAV